nr:4Fe-4S dicluster domain-containing protein [Candidatus Freyrarchaeum guaymaensis]
MASLKLQSISSFRHRVSCFPEGGVSLKYCMQCSLCSSKCPVARVVESFSPRRIVCDALLGLEDEVVFKDGVWSCLSCHSCLEACPMNVKVSYLITFFKNLAVERGDVPEGVVEEVKQIFKTGRTLSLSSAVEKRRASLSLPPPPSVNVDEVRALLKEFVNVLGGNVKGE